MLLISRDQFFAFGAWASIRNRPWGGGGGGGGGHMFFLIGPPPASKVAQVLRALFAFFKIFGSIFQTQGILVHHQPLITNLYDKQAKKRVLILMNNHTIVGGHLILFPPPLKICVRGNVPPCPPPH